MGHKLQSGEFPIHIFSYEYQGGFFYLYRNLSEDQVLQETVIFELEGLEIVSNGKVKGNAVTIKSRPYRIDDKRERYIYLRSTN